MGKLILVRHGQTEMNAQNLYFGKLNPPLNDLGIKQAYMAKEKLSNIAYDYIYSSPYDNRLEEINFGTFEGLTFKEISKKFPNEVKEMERNWKTFNYITGESPKEMFERAVLFLETLDYTKDNLVISHWGIINCIISYFVSGTLDTYWKFKVDNCSIVVFEGDFNFSYLTKLY